MKVLLALNHAPDYRESFLQELSRKVDLTVVAQPCEPDGLTPPQIRGQYKYIEIPSIRFLGFQFQSGISNLINFRNFDVICCNFNPRHPHWITYFIFHPKLQKKWVWWGQIYGNIQSKYLDVLRKSVLSRASGCLVYSEPIAKKIKMDYSVDATSFNNTEIQGSEFRTGKTNEHSGLNCLFVGRYQARKKLERLVELASRQKHLNARLIGPGMDKLSIPQDLLCSGQIELIPRTVGLELVAHFNWADIVVNPGHAGLLVMNAAKHGKGIVIDSESSHAPEYWLAKEADQPFIPFGNLDETDRFFDNVINNRELLQKWGNQLQAVAKEKYTVEHMAEIHYKMFKTVVK